MTILTLIMATMASLFAITVFAEGETPSADSLLKKAIQAVYRNNEESVYTMKLIAASGEVTTRKMKVWFKSKSAEEAKLMIKFLEPADIRGTGVLTIADKGKTSDQWLFLPALNKSRRIGGSSNKDESFLGSDFSMGDLSVDKDDSLNYKVEGSEKVDGSDCYKVVGTPKPGTDQSSLTYIKKVYFVRKDNGLGVKAEFYNQASQIEKVLSLQKIHKDGADYTADAIEMKNLQTKHATLLEFEKRDVSKVPNDNIFTINFLERK